MQTGKNGRLEFKSVGKAKLRRETGRLIGVSQHGHSDCGIGSLAAFCMSMPMCVLWQTKTYYVRQDQDGELEVDKAEGSTITWTQGKNPTVKVSLVRFPNFAFTYQWGERADSTCLLFTPS